MKKWQLFEQECCTFLSSRFSDYPFSFKLNGGSDSTSSDIEVRKGNRVVFSLEVKLSPSQSGQFVVMSDNGQYTYSPNNMFQADINARKIISHLNKNFESYARVKQSAINIDCPEHILNGWIKNHYTSKDSKFIITGTALGADKIVVPLDELEHWFIVSACLRRKRSGSRALPKSEFDYAERQIKNHFENEDFNIRNMESVNKKFIVTLDSGDLDKSKRYIGGNMFMSQDRSSSNKFIVKKLSSTNNANVVFSLRYKGNSDTDSGLLKLRDELKKYL